MARYILDIIKSSALTLARSQGYVIIAIIIIIHLSARAAIKAKRNA